MKKSKISWAILVFATVLFVFSMPVWATEITFDVTPKAKLVKLNIQHKALIKNSSEKMVFFEITLQNTDSVPNLYSITVVIPNAGAAEDFIPAAGEKNLEPKAEGKTAIGIASDKFPPKDFIIKVDTVETR